MRPDKAGSSRCGPDKAGPSRCGPDKAGSSRCGRTKPGPPDAARTKLGPPDAARTKPGPPAPRTLLEKKCAASLALTAAYATETEQFEYSVENGEARLTGLTDVGKAAVMLSIPAETAAGIPVTQIAGYALRDAKCYAPCCNARDYSHFLNSPCTNHSCIAQRNLRRGNQVREKVQTV